MFISFEGIDGCGKSTQSKLLAQKLQTEGIPVELTREPGGSDGAEAIRQLLIEGNVERWSAETEILLFNAARRDHLERTIRPALKTGRTVITDRFADSTRVYQNAIRKDLGQLVETIHKLVIGIEPDRTFIIDIDPDEGLKRARQRRTGFSMTTNTTVDITVHDEEDRFESRGLSFQLALRDGFHELAALYPERIRMIEGNGTVEDIAARVRAAL